jgi:Contractile injection system tube protein
MSDSPVRPRLSSGALAVIGDSQVIIGFQYNPEQVTRTIEPQMVGGQSDHAYAVRFTGAPKETITLQLRLDATDGLASSDAVTARFGIGNRLAQLELLAFPDIGEVIHREAQLAQGIIEIFPDEAPLVMLMLGPNRSMPVKVNQLSITEQAFDPMLNPIRATVDVTMQVLTYSDVLPSNPAYRQFVSYQQSLVRAATTVAEEVRP